MNAVKFKVLSFGRYNDNETVSSVRLQVEHPAFSFVLALDLDRALSRIESIKVYSLDLNDVRALSDATKLARRLMRISFKKALIEIDTLTSFAGGLNA